MRIPPVGLSEDHLARLLGEAWQFGVADIRYAPVGFGSHHWVATDANGNRRFVTLDELDECGSGGVSAGLARLRKALLTAHVLQDRARLSFVVAPLPTADGSALCMLRPGQAVAVYPFVEGHSYPAVDDTTENDRAAVVDVLAALHGATPAVLACAGVDDAKLSDRAELELALSQLTQPWSGGPFAEPARDMVASNASSLREALREYDRLAAAVHTRGLDWVITHGEPKADNLLVTDAGLKLVDWDTALMAPAARDLWLVDGGSDEALARYTDATGRRVGRDELTLYRLRWELTDIAGYTRWFRLPHSRTPDTEIAWDALSRTLQLSERWPELL